MNPYGPVTALPGQPLLPAGWRCSAFYWAARRGLPVTLSYLLELGLQAARIARWHGLPEARTPEGPYIVHQWPEWVFEQAAARLAADFAVAQAEYWRCPEPQGDAARDSVYGNGGDEFTWGDWLDGRQEERDAGWGEGRVPWDGDDIRAY
jgi:hypothetical protein